MIKFQYNKTSLQQIEKQLKMRQRTLPIIKNKETALRLEVKRCKEEVAALEAKLQEQIAGYERMYALWGEFDASLVELKDVEMEGIGMSSRLYSPYKPLVSEKRTLKFIPYFMWANRGENEMSVWVDVI